MIDITGLNKADVLAALYNASRPQGMGFLNYDKNPMTRQQAKELLKEQTYFDYLKGRVMKLDLKDNSSFDEWGYDRDNGAGAASKVIQSLRSGNWSKNAVNNPEFAALHEEGKQKAGQEVLSNINSKSGFGDKVGSFTTFTLGLSDVKDVLEPKVKEALG